MNGLIIVGVLLWVLGALFFWALIHAGTRDDDR